LKIALFSSQHDSAQFLCVVRSKASSKEGGGAAKMKFKFVRVGKKMKLEGFGSS
jgi:hypothetical protein